MSLPKKKKPNPDLRSGLGGKKTDHSGLGVQKQKGAAGSTAGLSCPPDSLNREHCGREGW